MSDSDSGETPKMRLNSNSSDDVAAARRRRKLDEVFGDDLPEQTSDDCDKGHNHSSAEWYRVNRPPHYE